MTTTHELELMREAETEAAHNRVAMMNESFEAWVEEMEAEIKLEKEADDIADDIEEYMESKALENEEQAQTFCNDFSSGVQY